MAAATPCGIHIRSGWGAGDLIDTGFTEFPQRTSCFYAQKQPNNVNRSWREASMTHKGNPWIATHPVLNADDYLFALSNVRDENNVVLLSDLKAVIPAKLGEAVATDIEGFRAANK